MKALVALGAVLIGLTVLALWMLMPWAAAEGSTTIRPPLVGLLAVTVVVYFLAVALVSRRHLPARAVWIVLAVGAAMRLPVLFTPPILSSDIYRYVWDGQVQDSGINPYLYVPADPALAALREPMIYPHINRADYARTIYPPAAQIAFGAIAHLSPTVFAMKTFMLGCEVLAVFCLLRLLALAGLPAERVLIYAWNPLAVWSFAGDGHIDALGIALLAGALLLRCLKRDGLSGALFGAAILVKFLPAVVGPALWRRGGGWRLVSAGSVMILALYACYANAGWRVLGFLPGYGAEEGLDSGDGIWLLAGLRRLGALPADGTAIYAALAVALLAIIGLRMMARRLPPPGTQADVIAVCGNAAVLAACATCAISPHYAWYFPWLAVPSVVRPFRAVVFLSAAPVLLHDNPFPGDWFLWPSLIYLPAAVLAVADLRRASLAFAVPSPIKGRV